MANKIFIFIISLILFPSVVFTQTYTVKKGDSIWKISKKFNISVNDIKKVNNLKSNKLQIGMKLEIPDKNTTKYHTVKDGENLFKIANKYNISVGELKRLNNLDSNRLIPGQKLIVKAKGEKIPVLASVKPDIKSKLQEIEEIKTSEDLSKMSIPERIILFAKKMLHLPYRFGGNNFYGLDCSFFVKKVYSMVGIELPRSAREQFTVGIPVSKEELQPGDLVFFRTYAKFPSHVGIYLGDNLFIHASTRLKKVTINSLEESYYFRRFIGAKRIVETDKEAIEEVKNQES